MGGVTDQIDLAWRDFNTDGVPGSGDYEPIKSVIRAIGPVIEAAISVNTQAVQAAAAIKNVLTTTPTALPFEVRALSGGVGTGSGGTPGTYRGATTGGPAGFQWSVTIGSDGKIASYSIDNPGISASNTAPTLVLPSGTGLTGATTPTATVGAIPTNRTFWAPTSTDPLKLVGWMNNNGGLNQISGLTFNLQQARGLSQVYQAVGTLTINRQAGTITTGSATGYLLTPDGTIPITGSQSVTLPTSTNTLYVYVVGSSGVIGVANNTAVPNGGYLIAIVTPSSTAEACYANAPGGNMTYVTAAGVSTTVGIGGTTVVGIATVTGAASFITINLQTGLITTAASGNGYASYAGGFRQIGNSQSVAITGFSSANSLFAVYVNMLTGVVGAIQAGAVPANCLPVAYVQLQILYPGASYALGLNPFVLINSSGATVTPSVAVSKPPAVIFNIGTWSIDFSARTVTTTGACYLDTVDGLVAVAAGQSLTIPTMSGAGRVYCASNGTLLFANNTTVPVGSYPIFSMKQNPTSAIDVFGLTQGGNATFTSSAGVVTTVGGGSGLKAFNQVNTRLLLPDDLFFVQGHAQPLYRNSLLVEDDPVLANSCTLLFDTGADSDSPLQGVGAVTNLDPATMTTGTVATVAMTHPSSNYLYTQPMTVHIVPTATVTGTTPKILCCMDSLGMFGMLRAYQDQLIALGVSPTFLGTFNSNGTGNPSSISGNLMGEARGSWSYRTFTGRDSTAAGTSVTRAQGTTTTQYQNPFLRVATSTDTTNNPTWCYAYTANTYKNPSYAENSTLGTYYIYDFANYLTNCSIATPDVVVIALGDNDVLWGGSAYTTVAQITAEAATALEIMVRSIRAAGVAKIVIVPLRARGRTTAASWSVTYAALIEAIQTKVRALKTAGITGITMVGTYAHTSRDYGFPTTTTALSSTNNEQVGTITDSIHWSTATSDGQGGSAQKPGKRRVARAEVPAILCALAGA